MPDGLFNMGAFPMCERKRVSEESPPPPEDGELGNGWGVV